MRLAVLALTALVLALSAAHAKNTTRSCDGAYAIRATLIDGLPPTKDLSWTMGEFSATASCGSTEPDHCRVIARDRIFRCFREHFADRWSRKRPAICLQVQGYGIDDLKTVMEQKVCCSPEAAPYDNISVALYGRTSGQGPCSRWPDVSGFPGPAYPQTAVIAPDYKLECRTLRAQLCPRSESPEAPSSKERVEKGVDRPGSDYISFNGQTTAECRRRCLRDARCRAYTWVRPGIQGRASRCWLKNKVPPAVKSDCCVSGVK